MKHIFGLLAIAFVIVVACRQVPSTTTEPNSADLMVTVSDVRTVRSLAPHGTGEVLACGFTATTTTGEVITFRISRNEFGASTPCDKCALLRDGDKVRITKFFTTFINRPNTYQYRWENWETS